MPPLFFVFSVFFAIPFAKLFFFRLTRSSSSRYSGRRLYPPGMLVLKLFRGLREKLSRSVWPFLVANSRSMKLSRPFPSSAAPLNLSFVLRETFVQRFYTGISSMIGGIVSLALRASHNGFTLLTPRRVLGCGSVSRRTEVNVQRLLSL